MKSCIIAVIMFMLPVEMFAQWQTVCSLSNVPKGWVIVDVARCVCCNNKGQFQTQWTIRNVDNLPVGSFVNVCSNSDLPAGWVITSETRCICCNGSGEFHSQWMIRKISASGKEPIPAGQAAASKPSVQRIAQPIPNADPERVEAQQWVQRHRNTNAEGDGIHYEEEFGKVKEQDERVSGISIMLAEAMEYASLRYHNEKINFDAGYLETILPKLDNGGVDFDSALSILSAKPVPTTEWGAGRKFVIDKYSKLDVSTKGQAIESVTDQIYRGRVVLASISFHPSFTISKDGIIWPKKIEVGAMRHLVLIVGWLTAKRQFIFRNTWGPGWGANGYGRIYVDNFFDLNPQLWVISDIKRF